MGTRDLGRDSKTAQGRRLTVERSLQEPQADARIKALANARARGKVAAAAILKQPEMLTARELGALIGVSPSTVNRKRKSGELLGLKGTGSGWRYPSWQITDGHPLPGLADLSSVLGLTPWSVYRCLLQQHPELSGDTALEALTRGRLEDVLELVRGIKEGNFA